jgi:hypothetical protein
MKTAPALLILLSAWSLLAQPPGPGGGSGAGIWRRNAAFGESQTFDSCEGHQLWRNSSMFRFGLTVAMPLIHLVTAAASS